MQFNTLTVATGASAVQINGVEFEVGVWRIESCKRRLKVYRRGVSKARNHASAKDY